MLLAMLIACVLLGSVSCGPSPTAPGVAVSEESSHFQPAASVAILSTAGPQASVTLDQVIAELSSFYQATARAATAEPLADIAKTLASIQTSVATVSGRLDLMYDSQLQLQKVQTSLAKRLDVIERSQTQASSRLDTIQSSLSRHDGMHQLQNETFSRLDTVQKTQSRAHSARFDGVEASLGALSSRIDTVLQQQTAAASRSAAFHEQLDTIQAAVSRIPKTVLGKACSRNTDCSRTLPEAVCSSDGLCSCQDGYRQVSDTMCRKQELHGRPAVAANTVPKPREPSPPSDSEEVDQILCTDSAIDAMVTIEMYGTKRTYAFKGANYWRLTSTGVEQGYPRRIRDMWDGVPDNLDAIMPHDKANRIYFFKGSQYWRMTNLKMDAGYPKPISRGFPGIPDNIDAAFKWVANGKPYFFKGSQYWRYDSDLGSTGRAGVSDEYPQPISAWKGIPNNIDAVLTYENKRTYFFKGNTYYRFNDVDLTVDSSYPRSTGQYWFGCDSQ